MRSTPSPTSLAAAVIALAVLCAAHPAPSAAPHHCRMMPAVVELDCNANGVEDALDIAGGYSADQDCDGVPDECQHGS